MIFILKSDEVAVVLNSVVESERRSRELSTPNRLRLRMYYLRSLWKCYFYVRYHTNAMMLYTNPIVLKSFFCWENSLYNYCHYPVFLHLLHCRSGKIDAFVGFLSVLSLFTLKGYFG